MARRTISHLNQVGQQGAKQKKYVSAYELSQYLGITERRIQQLAKEGMPRVGRGEYPLREAVRYYVGYLQQKLDENNNDTIVVQKARLMKAKATTAEIEAEKAGGAVLDLDQARQEVMFLAAEIKDVFFTLPGRLAPVLAGIDAAQVKIRLTDEITQAINRVAERLENYVPASTSGGVGTENA